MATVNAARAGKIPGRTNGLTPGDRADFVQFQWDAEAQTISVLATWISGRRVY
jgi:imidazolonepropionase-like amidohydrolase